MKFIKLCKVGEKIEHFSYLTDNHSLIKLTQRH